MVWLRASILACAESAGSDQRILAFDPLLVPPNEEPARFVSQWWIGEDANARERLSMAIAQVIETLEPSAPSSAAILIFRLAIHFNNARGLEPIYAYLSRPVRAAGLERRDLSEAIAHLGRRRGGAQDACELAYRLKSLKLLEPVAAIELLTYAAISSGPQIVMHLRTLLPALFGGDYDTSPASGRLYRYFANTLVDTVGVKKALEIALHAQKDMVEQVRFSLEFYRIEILDPEAQRLGGQVVIVNDRVTREKTAVEISEEMVRLFNAEVRSDLIANRVESVVNARFAETSVESKLKLERSPGAWPRGVNG